MVAGDRPPYCVSKKKVDCHRRVLGAALERTYLRQFGSAVVALWLVLSALVSYTSPSRAHLNRTGRCGDSLFQVPAIVEFRILSSLLLLIQVPRASTELRTANCTPYCERLLDSSTASQCWPWESQSISQPTSCSRQQVLSS